MTRVLLIGLLVAALFWVFTIVDCALQPPTRHRGVSKPIWLLIVVVIPVLGGILWLAVGRVRKSATRIYQAPDDDPEFLGRIGSLSDQDERIRKLEEELALLDSEAEDPRYQAPPAPAQDDGEPPAPRTDGDDDSRGQRGAVG